MMMIESASLPLLARTADVFRQFDTSILAFLNKFAHHSWYFDKFVIFVDSNNVIKSALIVSILWWLWYRRSDEDARRRIREQILLTIFVAFVALFFSRFLSFVLPFRVRPVTDPALSFLKPFTLEEHSFWSWSGFPSDHAVLFFSFAMSVRYISKKIGWLLFAYVSILICLPRLYLGVHYPTDILAGLIIGVGMAWLANTGRVKVFLNRRLIVPAMTWLKKSPGTFYAFLFLLTYQIADMFDQVRSVGSFVLAAAKHLLGR